MRPIVSRLPAFLLIPLEPHGSDPMEARSASETAQPTTPPLILAGPGSAWLNAKRHASRAPPRGDPALATRAIP